MSVYALNEIEEQWHVLGFIDDDPGTWGKDCCGIKVQGGRNIAEEYPDAYILAVPGNPDKFLQRRDIIEKVCAESSRFATIIHPSVVLSPDSHIGYNTLIMPNVIISCGARVGNHCVILPNTVVAHDSVIGDYCCIGANVTISGHVSIGSASYIGSGTSIRDNISIGERTLIGLGSNVVSDIQNGAVAAGNPARIMRESG